MTRLRIDMASPPFAGHLHPVLGLARALQPFFVVRILTTQDALPQVHAAGLDGHALLVGWENRLWAVVDTPSAVGSNPAYLIRQMRDALDIQRRLRVELEALYQSDRPGLLIADFTLVAAGIVASGFGIGWWTTLPSPCVLEGGDSPPAYFRGLKPMSGRLGSLRDHLAGSSMRLFKRTIFTLFCSRLADIGLHRPYRDDGSEAVYSNQKILAFGQSELEFRKSWPDCVTFLPMPLYTPPHSGPPPPFVPDRRHILITFGTHLKFVKDEFALIIRRIAARMPDIEFHFTDGTMTATPALRAGNFARLPFVNYQRHIRRYDLVIHHGGAGVMYHALAAGCPAIVYPIDYDQFDNAARLESAGLAVRLRHRSELESVIRRALAEDGLRRRCRQFECRSFETAIPALIEAIQHSCGAKS